MNNIVKIWMQCLNTSSGWLNYLRNNVWPVIIITFIFNEITIWNETMPLHHSCFQQIFKLEIPLLQQTIGSNLLEATTICYSSAVFKWKKQTGELKRLCIMLTLEI